MLGPQHGTPPTRVGFRAGNGAAALGRRGARGLTVTRLFPGSFPRAHRPAAGRWRSATRSPREAQADQALLALPGHQDSRFKPAHLHPRRLLTLWAECLPPHPTICGLWGAHQGRTTHALASLEPLRCHIKRRVLATGTQMCSWTSSALIFLDGIRCFT